jgi:hypothetical protein|tara:strand:+ start:1426 stop:1587 length:162 start_codon:yes stop_codon:yes gene_type:complete
MNKEKIMSVIRHSLTFIGGLTVTFGWIDESTFTELSGVAITLVGLVWGILDKQ